MFGGEIMKNRFLLSALFVLIVAAVVNPKTLKISRDKTILKDGPGNYYDNITVLRKNSEVDLIKEAEEDAGWYYVSYNSKKGYISKLALSERKKSADPFDSFGGEFNSGSALKNELSPASYTAAIKGFALEYSKKRNMKKVDLDSFFKLLSFKALDVIKVMNETKLAYFPKKGEMIGVQNAYVNQWMEGVGLAVSMNVLQNGIVYDAAMTKRLNIIANILIRQTYDYDRMYYVVIIKDPEPVAYSGPGGYIFISDTLITMLTDYREIVAILAHEIGHIAMRHGYRDLAIDTARENMKESFDELDSETLTEEEMELSDELQSIIDSAVEALKLVRDDIEEYEADDVALELLRRYKINRSYLKNTLAKVYLKLGSSYPEYKTQFERRISRIK